ncbi:MAG: HPr-rel-A system PqqD family peptide chaperone [Leptospiraceae bacterium]|nr:HPr-rel-A system PqqD family peptide chaperone [Leptospiraceae bacterium]
MDLNRLKNLALSETGFVFDPSTGNTFTLNDSAIFILKSLRDGSTAPDIARQLTAEFDVSDTQAGDDVTDALLQLKEAGLVGGVR